MNDVITIAKGTPYIPLDMLETVCTIIIFPEMVCRLSEGGRGVAEKSTLCTLVKMTKMMDDPLGTFVQ